ncbi:MAG: peptide-methionine (S)-S-oxide reductase MsrA [Myxococcota bacterium]|nr:peptide-methionine (S)-S-oxide reductase MsrA [Myxococcota bacterium]
MFWSKPASLPTPEEALPGRTDVMTVPEAHAVHGSPLKPPFPEGLEVAMFGLGCFWGAERCFWRLEGVFSTAVGYAAGHTPNPSYEEVCSGRTGHNEVVLVVFDPKVISYAKLVATFFQSHDPTQGMRQGNDVGTQYRSGIYTHSDGQMETAKGVEADYQAQLQAAGFGTITTEIIPAGPFYYAEAYHQQYLHKNPMGYCGLGGTGVSCPIGIDT